MKSSFLTKWAYLKIRFLEQIQYRAAAWAGVATQIAWAGMYIMLYSTFLENGTQGDMTNSQMATYIWLQQAFLSLLNVYNVDKEIFDQIRTGDIVMDLVKPVKIYDIWYYKTLGKKLAMVLLRFVPLLAISLFPIWGQFRLIIQTNPILLISSITALVLATSLTMSYIMIMLSLAMILISAESIRTVFRLTLEFLGGAIIPISFMPQTMQAILKFTPFYYMQNAPFNIYSGYINDYKEIGIMLITQIVWIIILTVISKIIIGKRTKKMIIQGS